MNEKQFLFAYDRKRTSTLTVDEQPGAHTGATRKVIPGYLDSNIVFRAPITGNDSNDGLTEATPKKNKAACDTAAGSTKKIRIIEACSLSESVDKPTEMKIGISGSISSSLTAPVATWTQSSTMNGFTGIGVAWAPHVSKFIGAGSTSKLYYSSDAVTWTAAAVHSFGSSAVNSVTVSQRNRLIIAAGGDGKIATSSDGNTYSQKITGFADAIRSIHFDDVSNICVAVSTTGYALVSDDLCETWRVLPQFTTVAFYSVAKSPTRWIIAGQQDELYYSDNGYIWTLSGSVGTDAIFTCFYSKVLGKFIVGDNAGDFYTSSDGITWTVAATPAFGASPILSISESVEISKIVAVGESGKIAYSSDGNTFTLAGTPSFAGDPIFGVAYSELLGKFAAVSTATKAAFSTAFASTISAPIAGFTIQAVQYSGTITAYNCSMRQPGTTAAITLDACRIEYDSHISNNAAKSRATLYRSDRHTTCTPAAQNDVDMNLDTIGGTWYIYNASQTGFERIRDCLVVGGIIANFPVTVSGRANTQGTSTNANFGGEVSHEDPRFVDTTDYKLEFQTNGYSRNSFAAGRSNLYFNSAGAARDVGAWSYIESAVSYFFSKSVYLNKGEITHGLEFALNEQQGDSGVVSVYGNTRRIKETITIAYGSTQEDERAVFDYMLTLTDKTVKIALDPEWDGNPGSVVVNGNQSAGVEFLTVDATNTFEGMWLTIAGKRYFVMRASPSPSAATKLILDRPLEDAVLDNDVIPRNYPSGAGEYQFAGPVNTQLKRVSPDGLQGWQRGFVIRLVRKKQ